MFLFLVVQLENMKSKKWRWERALCIYTKTILGFEFDEEEVKHVVSWAVAVEKKEAEDANPNNIFDKTYYIMHPGLCRDRDAVILQDAELFCHLLSRVNDKLPKKNSFLTRSALCSSLQMGCG